jgi:hypothetical protein
LEAQFKPNMTHEEYMAAMAKLIAIAEKVEAQVKETVKKNDEKTIPSN